MQLISFATLVTLTLVRSTVAQLSTFRATIPGSLHQCEATNLFFFDSGASRPLSVLFLPSASVTDALREGTTTLDEALAFSPLLALGGITTADAAEYDFTLQIAEGEVFELFGFLADGTGKALSLTRTVSTPLPSASACLSNIPTTIAGYTAAGATTTANAAASSSAVAAASSSRAAASVAAASASSQSAAAAASAASVASVASASAVEASLSSRLAAASSSARAASLAAASSSSAAAASAATVLSTYTITHSSSSSSATVTSAPVSTATATSSSNAGVVTTTASGVASKLAGLSGLLVASALAVVGGVLVVV